MSMCTNGTTSGMIDSPEAFLKAIGRSADSKITAETWTDLWKLDGPRLKAAGVDVKDRKCVNWVVLCLL